MCGHRLPPGDRRAGCNDTQGQSILLGVPVAIVCRKNNVTTRRESSAQAGRERAGARRLTEIRAFTVAKIYNCFDYDPFGKAGIQQRAQPHSDH